MKFSVRQILASAVGAVIAAVIASAFGVKGTIVGVAIGSAAATFGTALVAQSIERGQQAAKQVVVRASDSSSLLRRLGTTETSGASGSGSAVGDDASSAPTEVAGAVGAAGAGAASGSASGPGSGAGGRGPSDDTTKMESSAASVESTKHLEISAVADAPATERLQASTVPVPKVGDRAGAGAGAGAGGAAGAAGSRPGGPRNGLPSTRFGWKAIVGTAGIVFVLALLFVTAIELIAGKPLSSIFGDNGTGTSLNNIVNPPSSPASTTTTIPSRDHDDLGLVHVHDHHGDTVDHHEHDEHNELDDGAVDHQHHDEPGCDDHDDRCCRPGNRGAWRRVTRRPAGRAWCSTRFHEPA